MTFNILYATVAIKIKFKNVVSSDTVRIDSKTANISLNSNIIISIILTTIHL